MAGSELVQAEVMRTLVNPLIIDTVANLPTPGTGWRRIALATNGRKTGEGAGAGTGVLCYDDGTAWRRVDDGTTVAA